MVYSTRIISKLDGRRLSPLALESDNKTVRENDSSINSTFTGPSLLDSEKLSLSLSEHIIPRKSRVSLDGDNPRTSSSLKSTFSSPKSTTTTPFFSESSPQRRKRTSSFLLPQIDGKNFSNDLTAFSEKQTRSIPEEYTKECNLDVRNSPLSKIPQKTTEVEVKKIYEGMKIFLKEKLRAQIIMFEHIKPSSQELTSSSCIEIVSYIHGFETIDVPRIYVSSSKIFPRLNNKLIVQGSLFAQETIVSYLFNRLSVSVEEIDDKQTFGINLKYKNDCLANDLEFSGGVKFDGEPRLGPLPVIDHITQVRSPVQVIWDEKMSLFTDDMAKSSKATIQASRKSLTVLNQFPKDLLEDGLEVSIPRRRWCKSIRKVIIKLCVKTMEAKLIAISSSRDENERKFDEDIVSPVSARKTFEDNRYKNFHLTSAMMKV